MLQLTVFCFLLIQTFARPEAIHARHADYAASITGKILSFYEKYFEINYQQKTLGKTLSRRDQTDVLIDGNFLVKLYHLREVPPLTQISVD